MPESPRERLRDLIRTRAFRYRPADPFTLVSGRKSPFYFNCKAVSLTGEGLNLLGEVLAGELGAFGTVRAVGGLTLGADPLALALAAFRTRTGAPLDAFVIRKEAKAHGTRRFVEGEVAPSTPVVVVDDVVTTGGSTVKAIERAHAEGLDVRGALVLVDREEEDGMAHIEQALRAIGAPPRVRAVFRAGEFVDPART